MREQDPSDIFDPAIEQPGAPRGESVSQPSKLRWILRVLRGPDLSEPLKPLWTQPVDFDLTGPETAIPFRSPEETTEDRLRMILGEDYRAPDD